MITYIDTSSLLKLLIDEDGSEDVAAIWDAADVLAAVQLIVVEARAALAAAERGARLSTAQHGHAKSALVLLVDGLVVIEVSESLIESAAELAEREALRGYDAVHLAAAHVVEADVFLSADTALCEAAERRGFHVANALGA